MEYKKKKKIRDYICINKKKDNETFQLFLKNSGNPNLQLLYSIKRDY